VWWYFHIFGQNVKIIEMKKLFSEIVQIEKLVPGGQGLGVLSSGKTVFIWNALPGEKVVAEIYKMKSSYAEAVAVEILESSPYRIPPRDDCYLSTSPWQMMDYEFELQMKTELVDEIFRQNKIDLVDTAAGSSAAAQLFSESSTRFSDEKRIFLTQPTGSNFDELDLSNSTKSGSAGLPAYDVFLGKSDSEKTVALAKARIVTDNKDFFYRNKMEYSLWWDNDKRKIFLAFHKRGSHQKIPIAQSSIERPEIFAEATRIVTELNANQEEARKYQSLLVRCNQKGEVSSALFENYQSHPTMKNLTDDILGQEYSYSPNGFFQINLPVYEMALKEIARHLGNAEKVVDMYSGVGTIGLSVARDRELTLVETDKNAFKELLRNVEGEAFAATPLRATLSDGESVREDTRDDGLAGRRKMVVGKRPVKAIHAKSEEALDYITDDITLILDPPRAGLDEKVIARILGTKPPRVIYLSCNPATQARDIAKLLPKYKITHHQAFNFFPRTPHIENLIALEISN